MSRINKKGHRVPLHFFEKVELELGKLIQDKQITKLQKAPMTYLLAQW